MQQRLVVFVVCSCSLLCLAEWPLKTWLGVSPQTPKCPQLWIQDSATLEAAFKDVP